MFGDHCQCRACQRHSGTGHSSGFALPRGAVTITGEVRWWRTRAESGNEVGRGFCPTCGAPLLFETSGLPELIFLSAGSLDDPARFRPEIVVFAADAQPWDTLDPALPRYPGMPPH